MLHVSTALFPSGSNIVTVLNCLKHQKPKPKDLPKILIADDLRNNPLVPLSTYQDGYAVVPDVRGMSIRKAKKMLIKSNLRAKFKGSGHVVWQSPTPGTKKLPGTICTIGLN